MKTYLLLIPVIFFSFNSLFCQLNMYQVSDQNLHYTEVVDFENDGDLDLISFPFVHLNDGKGNREKTIQYDLKESVKRFKLLYLNKDKLIDVVAFLANEEIAFYKNTGKGFIEIPQSNKLDYYEDDFEDISIIDFNADGFDDLVYYRYRAGVAFYTNNGEGVFSHINKFQLPFGDFDYMVSGNLDKDRDVEIITFRSGVNGGSELTVFDLSSNNYQVRDTFSSPVRFVNDAIVGDVDNDGDNDLIYSNKYDRNIMVSFNEKGSFSHVDSISFDKECFSKITTNSRDKNLQLIDINSNGELALVSAYCHGETGSIAYWENLSTKNFQQQEKKILSEDKILKFEIADFNDDGFMDIVQFVSDEGLGARIEVVLNGFNETEAITKEWLFQGSCMDLDFIDLNNDGIEDLLGVNRYKKLFYHLGKKDGTFHFESFAGESQYEMRGFELADLNGDGLEDVFWTSVDQKKVPTAVGWFKNLGKGNFDKSELILSSEFRFIETGVIDFDNDKDLDIIVCIWEDGFKGGIYAYVNEGNGVFDTLPLTVLENDYSSLKILDINNDGINDINNITAYDQGMYVYENGEFQMHEWPFQANVMLSQLFPIKLNSNDKQDYVISGSVSGKLFSFEDSIPNQWTKPRLISDKSGGEKIDVADIDRDGLDDILCLSEKSVMHYDLGFGDGIGFSNQLYLTLLQNKDEGKFEPLNIAKVNKLNVLRLKDLDEDGNLEIVIADRFNGIKIYSFNNEEVFQKSKPAVYSQEVFTIVEEMPRFIDSSCEDLLDKVEKETCAKEALNAYVTSILYPKKALKGKLEGTAFIKFVVVEDGNTIDHELAKSSGHEILDQAAMEWLKNLTFIPGYQRKNAVKVAYIMPVKFKL